MSYLLSSRWIVSSFAFSVQWSGHQSATVERLTPLRWEWRICWKRSRKASTQDSWSKLQWIEVTLPLQFSIVLIGDRLFKSCSHLFNHFQDPGDSFEGSDAPRIHVEPNIIVSKWEALMNKCGLPVKLRFSSYVEFVHKKLVLVTGKSCNMCPFRLIELLQKMIRMRRRERGVRFLLWFLLLVAHFVVLFTSAFTTVSSQSSSFGNYSKEVCYFFTTSSKNVYLFQDGWRKMKTQVIQVFWHLTIVS